MHRLQGDCQARVGRGVSQLPQRIANQPPGMAQSVTGASAAGNHQATGPYFGRQMQSVESVVDRLAKRLAIRTGEAPRTPETGDG